MPRRSERSHAATPVDDAEDPELDDPDDSDDFVDSEDSEDVEHADALGEPDLDDDRAPLPSGSEALDAFNVASNDYLPPPAGLWSVVGALFGSMLVSTLVYAVVAAVGGFSIPARGGPGYGAGVAAGQLATGDPFVAVKSMGDISLAGQTLLQLPFWATLAVPLPILAWLYGPGITRLIGLRVRAKDALVGLPAGVALQLVAIPGLYWVVTRFLPEADVSEPARQLIEKAYDPAGVICLVLIVGIGAPIFEELLYRGLALRMMERRIGTTYAIVASSLVFAVSHFQPLQFPGLFVFGVLAAVLTVRSGRLGPAMWAHLGFNLTTVVILVGNFFQ